MPLQAHRKGNFKKHHILKHKEKEKHSSFYSLKESLHNHTCDTTTQQEVLSNRSTIGGLRHLAGLFTSRVEAFFDFLAFREGTTKLLLERYYYIVSLTVKPLLTVVSRTYTLY